MSRGVTVVVVVVVVVVALVVGSAAGVVSGPGDGLHGSQRGDEHRGARLLPRDEEPVRADGQHAWVAWLLPKDCTWRSR